MNAPQIGLALRLLGPLIEISCLALLLRGSARNRATFGLDPGPVLYVGVAVGLAMVAVGLGLTAARPGRAPRPRRDDPPAE